MIIRNPYLYISTLIRVIFNLIFDFNFTTKTD